MTGANVSEEYRLVNRTVSGQGIQHAKSALVGDELIVGSCNWTTSSRSNYELGVLIRLRESSVAQVKAVFEERLRTGVLLREDPGARARRPYERSSSRSASAQRSEAYRSYSLEPGRSYSLEPGAG